jgi:hypothetical protein
MNVLAIDPSGNFTEGKGTTGWSLIDEDCNILACGQIKAELFQNKIAYWNGVVSLVEKLNPNYIVVEDFLLYAHKSSSQINSRFETVKLIGILEYVFTDKIPITLQRAVDVKNRWNENILVKKGIITQKNNHYYAAGVLTTDHIRDSIKHGIHFIKFKLLK